MAIDFQEPDFEETATQTGMKWLGRILAIVIVLVVAAFGDIMYIQLMSSHFPVGPLLVLCYIGAFTSFLAIVYMLIGKSILFTPGRQMVLAWLIFGLELALIALNIILVFQDDGANATGFLAAWLQAAPATPVINMAGVAVLFFLDEDGRVRHEDMELSWEMKRANRRHFKALHRARMRLQHKQLDFLVTSLERAVSSPESLQTIEQTAIDLNTTLLSQLSGRNYGYTRAPVGALPAGGSDVERPLQSAKRYPGPQPVLREEAARLDANAVPATGPKKGGWMARARSRLRAIGQPSEWDGLPPPPQPTITREEAARRSQAARAQSASNPEPSPAPAKAPVRRPVNSRVEARRRRRMQRLHVQQPQEAANNGNSFRSRE